MADDTTPSDPGSADPSGSDTTDAATNYVAVGEQLGTGLFKNLTADGISDVGANIGTKLVAAAAILIKTLGAPAAAVVGKALAEGVDVFAPVAGAFTAPVVAGMFGGEVDPAVFADASNSAARNAVAQALINTFIDNLTGGASGPIEADDAGAKRVASAGLHSAIEGWFLSAIPEMIGDCIPFVDVHIEALARLPEEVTRALGVGRMVRSALNPLIKAVATTPMQWKANTTYRPTKLPAATAVKQFLRGAYDDTQLSESLARDGYRDEDMDALVNDAKKFLPLNDLALLLWFGTIDQGEAVQTLADQGYDQQTASKIFIADQFRRREAVNRSVADAAVLAFVEGHIDELALNDMLDATLTSTLEQGMLHDAAVAKRALHVIPLSPAEAEAAVLANISPMSDYTDALTRAGRSPDAITVLELLLRVKMDKTTAVAAHQKAAADAKAAAAAAKAATTATHVALVQEAAQRKALGSLNTLERAVIHGLIPIDRLEQLLSLEFPSDTVAIYVADVQQRATAYAAAQAKATNAAKKVTSKALSLGALRSAFLDGILTEDQIRPQLEGTGLADDEIDVLFGTWQQALDAKTAAAKLHTEAAARAQAKHLSIADAETLTVSGHWSIADFNAYLATLGFNDGDAAHLDLIVQDRIDKQKAAAGVKSSTTATNKAKGLSLGQMQKAVVLGDTSLADFQAWLVQQNFTADAISVLVAETQTAIDAANSARARRSTAATDADGRPSSLAEVSRAARLGLITPADYQAALEARGFTPDAIALELQLLSYEIAHAKQPAPAAGSATAAIASSGTSPLTFANKRHVAIDGELAGKGLSLADAENAVKNSELTYDAFQQWLLNQGYETSDAELLRALLGIKLGAPGS